MIITYIIQSEYYQYLYFCYIIVDMQKESVRVAHDQSQKISINQAVGQFVQSQSINNRSYQQLQVSQEPVNKNAVSVFIKIIAILCIAALLYTLLTIQKSIKQETTKNTQIEAAIKKEKTEIKIDQNVKQQLQKTEFQLKSAYMKIGEYQSKLKELQYKKKTNNQKLIKNKKTISSMQLKINGLKPKNMVSLKPNKQKYIQQQYSSKQKYIEQQNSRIFNIKERPYLKAQSKDSDQIVVKTYNKPNKQPITLRKEYKKVSLEYTKNTNVQGQTVQSDKSTTVYSQQINQNNSINQQTNAKIDALLQSNTRNIKIEVQKSSQVTFSHNFYYTKYDLSNITDFGQVINIPYNQTRPSILPLDPLTKNELNQSFQQALYSVQKRRQRLFFINYKNKVIDSKTHLKSARLLKYNIILDKQMEEQAKIANQQQWSRINKRMYIGKMQTQLPMCIIVPGFNNNANFRIQQNLNSIFMQNYSNYRVVIIDDNSKDGSMDVYTKYLTFYNIHPNKYLFIRNTKRVTALQNIYLNAIKHCAFNDIVVTVDADDELIGRNVFQVFNWGYQTLKSGVLYSNYYHYNHVSSVMDPGFTYNRYYTDNDKRWNRYRTVSMRFSHLRSFRNQLLHQIDPKDLQDSNGLFFKVTYDLALFFPLMELSCKRVDKIQDQYHYLYNRGTGFNDDENGKDFQKQIQDVVRKRKPYSCYQQFDNRMKRMP